MPKNNWDEISKLANKEIDYSVHVEIKTTSKAFNPTSKGKSCVFSSNTYRSTKHREHSPDSVELIAKTINNMFVIEAKCTDTTLDQNFNVVDEYKKYLKIEIGKELLLQILQHSVSNSFIHKEDIKNLL